MAAVVSFDTIDSLVAVLQGGHICAHQLVTKLLSFKKYSTALLGVAFPGPEYFSTFVQVSIIAW